MSIWEFKQLFNKQTYKNEIYRTIKIIIFF